MEENVDKVKRLLRDKFDVFFYDIELTQWITLRAKTCPMLEMCKNCEKEWRCANYQAPGLSYVYCGFQNKEWRV